MPRIQVLPKHIAELIAAGEVVERPASVVKELAENAIDAGATVLTVELRGGGVQMIRVTDNGCGIARDDIRAAFLSHATSKIAAEEELNRILTLGFRGEALASVAAVARVQMLSRAAGEDVGVCYEMEGGEEVGLEDAGCPPGTTVVVRDLFYQTPARMKFLKKDVAEGNAAAAVLERLALSRPDVSVTMIREGKTVLRTPGDGTAAGAVRAALGKDFYEQMVGASGAAEGAVVSGFVCEPRAGRPNRNMQYFFLNGRAVRCPAASAALGEAYKNTMMAGKYPSCVLYITLPPEWVDINVHPTKMEVRFANDRPVFQAVFQAARSALLGAAQGVPFRQRETAGSSAAPPVWQEDFWETAPSSAPVPAISASVVRGQPAPAAPSVLRDGAGEGNPLPQAREEPVLIRRPVPPPDPKPEEIPRLLPEGPEPVRVIGEAFRTYLLAERREELLVIDKHAAHERILFERMKAGTVRGARQVLLAPMPLTLSREEAAALLEHGDLLRKAGFVVEEFGEGTAAVRECPAELTGADLPALAAEIAGYLLDRRRDLTTEAQDWILHSAACRAAVKAGDPTSAYEQDHFVQELLAMPDIRTCPHGRPVMTVISRKELEKSFGRLP
ncbi:MAG: DNA mismatch repair endonuclease MutL [Oscillospiraceae bacterium]|jgi:DNA mismatch repair protein MutL|nr:DNA mismatch repair endonuclease MutL [Oscillospiraceae bacterium]